MVEIRHEGRCEAPLEVAFAYLDDYRHATRWMFGLSRFEPVGDLDHGLGAEFDGTFSVKPVTLSARIRITQWVANELIAFESIDGFRNWSTWTFHAEGPDRARIDVLFGYELPGGLAGRLLGRALEPVVALTIRRTEETLRHEIEAFPGGSV
jgi:uncharacterized membrane protein